WLAGFVFYLATVYWVAYTITRYTAVPFALAVAILVLMASVLAIYHGAFVAGVRWLETAGLPALWLAPLLWVTLEWLRGWFFIGFPWAALGYSQYRHHDLVQIAEVTGVYGVSAILVLFNMVIAGLQGASPRRLAPALLTLTALAVAPPPGGPSPCASLAHSPPARAPRRRVRPRPRERAPTRQP